MIITKIETYLEIIYEGVNYSHTIWAGKGGKTFDHIAEIHSIVRNAVEQYNIVINTEEEKVIPFENVLHTLRHHLTKENIAACFRVVPKSTIEDKNTMLYHKKRTVDAFNSLLSYTEHMISPPFDP